MPAKYHPLIAVPRVAIPSHAKIGATKGMQQGMHAATIATVPAMLAAFPNFTFEVVIGFSPGLSNSAGVKGNT
jgi:hypothetical protein